MRWNDYEIDLSDKIKTFKEQGFSMFEGGCSACGQNPCICGSKAPKEKPCNECKADDPHKNLEQLAKKIVPLVDEINEELERHAAICKRRVWGDDEAGYPPNCNKGFVEKDGKCVPVEKEEANMKKKGIYSNLWKKTNQKNNI